jgi:hypothetical protein
MNPSLHDPRGSTSVPSGLYVRNLPPTAQIKTLPVHDIPKVKALCPYIKPFSKPSGP